MKMILLKILESSQENTCTEVSLCNKVARITPTNLLKKRVQHRGFTVNSVKYLTTAFLHNLRTGALLFYQEYCSKFFISLKKLDEMMYLEV